MWQPIKIAPKDGTVILVVGESDMSAMYIASFRYWRRGDDVPEYYSQERQWRAESSGRFSHPKYWMPLPERP